MLIHTIMIVPRRASRRPRVTLAAVPVPRTSLALGQGLYFLLTGLWPLVSMRTFEAVTGPKTDRWLVKTVGVLVAVIGTVLTGAATKGRVSDDVAVLAVGSAAGLGGIDIVYAARGRISKIYLLDAVLEALLIGGWLVSRRRVR